MCCHCVLDMGNDGGKALGKSGKFVAKNVHCLNANNMCDMAIRGIGMYRVYDGNVAMVFYYCDFCHGPSRIAKQCFIAVI